MEKKTTDEGWGTNCKKYMVNLKLKKNQIEGQFS